MADKLRIDPNILFRKIRNQFLAAIIGICVTIAILLSATISYRLETMQLVIIVVAFLIIASLAVWSIISLNKYSPEFSKIQKQGVDTRMIAQRLTQIILSFGETCLEVSVTDNRRGFAADALATSVQTIKERLTQADRQFAELLDEIKSISDSEKSLKDVCEVLKGRR